MEKLTASLTALLLLLIVGCEERISAPELPAASVASAGDLQAGLGGIHNQLAAEMITDNNWDIFLVNADGSGSTNLTNHPFNDAGPVWSPNGQKIAFDRGGFEYREIFVMNADGSDQQNLSNHPAGDGDPDWSPNGQQIAFTSDRDGITKVFVMNADGTNPHALTDMLTCYQGNPRGRPTDNSSSS